MKKSILLIALVLCLSACGPLETGLEKAKGLIPQGTSQKENKKENVFEKVKEIKNDTPLSKGQVGSVNGVELYHEAENHKSDPSLMIDNVNDFQGGRNLVDLTELGDYLVDYEMGATMIRELIFQDPANRYEGQTEPITPDDEDVSYALEYFNYLTEINRYLSKDDAFEGVDLYPTLIWAKKYKGTELRAYYFREYTEGDIRSSGNQALVVMDKNNRLVHYLSYGKRNPLALEYKPTWSKKTAINHLVEELGIILGGIDDYYDLEDFYYQVPAFSITKTTDKQYKPQFTGEYQAQSGKNTYVVYARHDGDHVTTNED